MKSPIMKLTEKLEVTNGGHILYFYENIECYVNNAVSYIVTGIEQRHHLLVIDSRVRFQLINEKLKTILSAEQLTMVYYVDNFDFYRMYGDFHCRSIVKHFGEIIESFIEKDISIRTWAHGDWKEQDGIVAKLEEFENVADHSVNEMGLISVCAYNANTLTASLQMIMMRNHEYFMTDKELVRSALYKNTHKTVIFPSLSVQMEMQSELDLYKKKLDFVHVVSHEVRNPLTVIKAFCSIMLNQGSGSSEENANKISAIRDYVDVIDNEMNHIIHTVQMLSNDLLWDKEIIDPLPVIQSVMEFMNIKARTQHIKLQCKLDLEGKEKLIINRIGLKLILSNLLSNAIKYSQECSVVTFSIFTDNGNLVIKVKDQGIGMSKEQMDKLFAKYGKLNQNKNGQGIGLYMVKKLLDHFEGMLHMDSKLAHGTEVTVKLPLVTRM
jgi:signal transduction histidine kinase